VAAKNSRPSHGFDGEGDQAEGHLGDEDRQEPGLVAGKTSVSVPSSGLRPRNLDRLRGGYPAGGGPRCGGAGCTTQQQRRPVTA